jgi:ubiquinone/menaquinone biosynthesis C-methylase UbiE
MQEFITRPSLYNFLRYTNSYPLEKNILDCGAGGDTPPLYLFHLHGYATFGIDISDNQLDLAHKFCQKMNVDLNIQKGDMRNLKLENESFSFIY